MKWIYILRKYEKLSKNNSVESLQCGNIFIPHATVHGAMFRKRKWNTSESIIRNS